MYLLVFVTLVVSMLGLYTQVYALQVSRMNAKQTGVAETMLQWHYTALALAKGHTIGTYCLFQDSTSTFGPTNLCPTTPQNMTIMPTGNPTANLPVGYQASLYRFNSVFFSDSAVPTPHYFVLTYVSLPAGGPNTPISLPAPGQRTIQIGLTMNDLIHQMGRINLPAYTYGTTQYKPATSMPTPSPASSTLSSSAQGISYSLPLNTGGTSVVPSGALAIISPL